MGITSSSSSWTHTTTTTTIVTTKSPFPLFSKCFYIYTRAARGVQKVNKHSIVLIYTSVLSFLSVLSQVFLFLIYVTHTHTHIHHSVTQSYIIIFSSISRFVFWCLEINPRAHTHTHIYTLQYYHHCHPVWCIIIVPWVSKHVTPLLSHCGIHQACDNELWILWFICCTSCV